ncbi:STAS domain-containing protein [Peribacillus saganii]|uniref:STAS domain-containing protein n=1 Tax=Peribacillus saganii TaxID=2303992 RepID=A0A372LNZ9_9BACI|nr:STAS domain-containing protein [Peribacillus saganii]RFU69459.1 STAS domain-containing protein [Peribacillus saganii]
MNTSINIPLREISSKVISQKEKLAHERFLADHNSYSSKVDVSLQKWRENLISIFAQSIIEDLDYTYEKLKKWGADGVNLLVEMGLPLDLAIEEVRFYRNTIGNIIKDESIEYNFSLEEFYNIISRFDSIVDRAVHWLSLSYSSTFSSRIYAAEATALELSIPIVRITEEIGILPLVGDLDTKRSQELMDKALNYGTNLQLSHIVIELSGVPIIDTMVANHIFKVIDALKLVGIKVILTGIRPEIAQTMVNLGLKLEGISTFASLHQAVKNIQNQK